MEGEKRFDPAKLAKLNDPARIREMEPERMAAALALAPGCALADVGAGTGVFAFELARLLGAAVVHAIDDEPLMLEYTAEHVPADLAGTVLPLAGSAEALPLGDTSVDGVFAINLYHELDPPEAMLAEAARVLRPGGRMLIVDWKAEPTPKGPPLDHRVPAERVAAALEAEGFTSVAIDSGLAAHYLVSGTRA
jgi:ubiquinone/menaquinone biosynthesis C-methylase UbiE